MVIQTSIYLYNNGCRLGWCLASQGVSRVESQDGTLSGKHCAHGVATCCCCSVYNHSLCQYFCLFKSQPMLGGSQVVLPFQTVPLQNHPQQPQLALSLSAGSLKKMHLSIASHTLLCSSCWFCPIPSLCYNLYSHIWQLLALKLNHTYHISCTFSFISLQFAAVWLCPSRGFVPQKCYYSCWELTFSYCFSISLLSWISYVSFSSSSGCSEQQWRCRAGSGTSLGTPQWGHLQLHICRALPLQAAPPFSLLFELMGSNLHFGATQSSPAGLALAGVIFFIVASMGLCFKFVLKIC